MSNKEYIFNESKINEHMIDYDFGALVINNDMGAMTISLNVELDGKKITSDDVQFMEKIVSELQSVTDELKRRWEQS